MKNLLMCICLLIAILWAMGSFSRALAQKSTPVKGFTQNVALQGAKSVNIELTQAAGTLNVRGGASQLMESSFAFSKEEWKPEISYTRDSDKGKLRIKQPKSGEDMSMDDGDRNDWQVRLSNAVPLDLAVTIGAGQSNIDLHNMKLSNLLLEGGAGDFTLNLANTSLPALKVNAGVGEMKIDLTGQWNNSLEAQINGGIGEVTLKLPRKTGVRVKVNGLGSIEANGFKKEGKYYVNDAYASGSTALLIEINGGLGSVNLNME